MDLMQRPRIPQPASPLRAAVVLYACIGTASSGDALALVRELRAFAEARDWVVSATHTDRAPVGAVHRPGWAEVQRLIDAGAVQGIVAPAPAMCTDEPVALAAWLQGAGAFASYLPQAVILP